MATCNTHASISPRPALPHVVGFYVLLDVDANKQWTSEDRVAQSSLSHVPSFQAPSAPSPPDPLATNLQHATQVAEQLARARGVLPKQQLVETAAVPSAPALLQPQSMCSDSCAKVRACMCVHACMCAHLYLARQLGWWTQGSHAQQPDASTRLHDGIHIFTY